MPITSPNGAPDKRTMTAVIAAVQAYLDGESRPTTTAQGRSSWKSARWGTVRSGWLRKRRSWRTAE